MANFVLVTDSTADLPISYIKEHNIELLHLKCIMDGIVYGKDNPIDPKEFYAKVRGGALPTTSQINPEDAKELFTEILKTNKNILYLAFSSGLSGTYQSGMIGANEIMEEDPEAKIIVVDTLCASLGEGLIVNKAVRKMETGATLEETAEYIEKIKLNIGHVVAVDDLFHLYRGGRVSKATAIVGSIISVKPLIHVNNEGKLINIDKCRGRKKSLMSLVDMMEERLGSHNNPDDNDVVYISHSDCYDDAKMVADAIKEKFGFNVDIIDYIGPVIGAHTGPGTVALFFTGDFR